MTEEDRQKWLEKESFFERPIKVFITSNEIGQCREYPTTGLFNREDGAFWDYIWSEGNFACDCNRELFFADAAGEEEPEGKCGDDAFSIRITDAAGNILYDECD